jgi:hypothetical protein
MTEGARVYKEILKNTPVIKRRPRVSLKLVKTPTKNKKEFSGPRQIKTSLEKDGQEWLQNKQRKLEEDRKFIIKHGLDKWVVWKFQQDWAEYQNQLSSKGQKTLSKEEAQRVIDDWINKRNNMKK